MKRLYVPTFPAVLCSCQQWVEWFTIQYDDTAALSALLKYESVRNKLYSDITNIFPNFEYLSPKEKFTYMLTADGGITCNMSHNLSLITSPEPVVLYEINIRVILTYV